MRRLFLLLCLGAVASAEEHAFLETITPRDTYYVRESIRLTLRIGIDRAYFESNVVQMFQRELDVPAQVEAPWLDELAGTILREPEGGQVTIAVNDTVIEATRAKDRDGFTVVEIRRTYVPTNPGDLVVSAPRLRYAYGTKFRDDFVHGRIAVDRRDAFVTGRLLTIKILALPKEGRPRGFAGAVGRFTVKAEAAPRRVEAGATLKLTLRIEGEGNLESFDTPRLELAGFHVYGSIDEESQARRTIVYDLAPLDAGVAGIPSIVFTYFDPRTRSYETARTEPITLDVQGDVEVADSEDKPGNPLLIVAAVLVAICASIWFVARKRKRTPSPAAVFRVRSSAPHAVIADALADYLAARLGCARAAVIAPGLATRLVAADVKEELANRTAALLESMVAARYGGGRPEDATNAAREVVDALEAEFRRRGVVAAPGPRP